MNRCRSRSGKDPCEKGTQCAARARTGASRSRSLPCGTGECFRTAAGGSSGRYLLPPPEESGDRYPHRGRTPAGRTDPGYAAGHPLSGTAGYGSGSGLYPPRRGKRARTSRRSAEEDPFIEKRGSGEEEPFIENAVSAEEEPFIEETAPAEDLSLEDGSAEIGIESVREPGAFCKPGKAPPRGCGCRRGREDRADDRGDGADAGITGPAGNASNGGRYHVRRQRRYRPTASGWKRCSKVSASAPR